MYQMFLHVIFLTGIIAIVQAAPHNLTFSVSRIFAGVEAKRGEFPHLVSLQWGSPPLTDIEHFCAGSIIHSQWILTAAHCVNDLYNYDDFVVKAGKHQILQIESGEQVARVERSYVHENYRDDDVLYDIALIKLKQGLKLNDKIRAIALPKPHSQPQENAKLIVADWEAVSESFDPFEYSVIFPDALQKVNVTLVDLNTCRTLIDAITGGIYRVHETNLCTSGVAACLGGSGGSLINEDLELVGIVSWGAPCDDIFDTAEVFTRVSAYIDWIDAKLPYELRSSCGSELCLLTPLPICSLIGILRFTYLLSGFYFQR